ncbi:flagella basal body P-ring formation protein FlgA [Tepidimonas alkaliphilus]|uniref:Flagella basal body P-ring formation protein FlgA n=1 Tax=Tepidimonas alkaliphilus TaxID=2588942 RepID=A0A554WB22_9BURK|nr:flagellar basal body P-ring formation chaperone FlgA [Tepidimonas alkaliphilus]TSE20777.1 flagella basal body P-ring formation protein FlgA [Tepidimonas alkaliphilus]
MRLTLGSAWLGGSPLPTATLWVGGLRRGRTRWRQALAAALATWGVLSHAAPVGSAQWRNDMAHWLQVQADTQMQAVPLAGQLRAQVEVGSLDPRLRLAPCERVEPYLPPGTRLWGRSRIGLRCTDGPVAWNVFLPIYVRVWGPGWVLNQPLPPGTQLEPAHAQATEVEWTAQRQAVLVQPQDWVGQQTTRAMAAGQVLLAGSVRAPQVFASGSTVKLRVQGPGFTLTATGEALAPGHLGETVRVRLPNKKVVLGTVVDATTVDVPL